ncbi:hypothetical protein JHK85_006528 [Glycine max]|uniref:Aspartic proteinase oryzasin-1 n=1 Tax=Glycine soja TaxID=3848 RepID=A0A445L7L4_GLYSO|nr:hypothetical protein JHK85_006528 [Glycine max]KAH1068677.1 hypothetical protein GYH30_006307 [Glycine max]RZC19155.1 Aspartic proteinase oryzasin-1 [Glycine soja]
MELEWWVKDGIGALTQPKKICSRIGLCALMGLVVVGIKSVVDENERKSSGDHHGAACPTCEMAIVWMQNQLSRNQTQDQILSYINQLCDKMPSPMGESAVDCGNISSLPVVSFTIGGRTFELSPEELVTSRTLRCLYNCIALPRETRPIGALFFID